MTDIKISLSEDSETEAVVESDGRVVSVHIQFDPRRTVARLGMDMADGTIE